MKTYLETNNDGRTIDKLLISEQLAYNTSIILSGIISRKENINDNDIDYAMSIAEDIINKSYSKYSPDKFKIKGE